MSSLANPEVINSRSVIARSTGSPLRPRRISNASDMLSKYLVSWGDMPKGGLGIPGNFVGVRLMFHESPPSTAISRTRLYLYPQLGPPTPGQQQQASA